MPTDLHDKKTDPIEVNFVEESKKVTFFEKMKFLFSKFIESVGNFFRNLFARKESKTVVYEKPMKPISASDIIKTDSETDEKNHNVKIDENDKENHTFDDSNKQTKVNDPILLPESGTYDAYRDVNTDDVVEDVSNGSDVFFVEEGTNIVEDENEFIVPVLEINDIGDDVFDYEENEEQSKEILLSPSEYEDVFEDEIDEPAEIKTPKEELLDSIRKIDTRAISITSQKDSITILFELEDESNILVDIEQNGNIKSLNKIIPGFDAVTDNIGLNASIKTTSPVTSAEIGFDATLSGLSILMQENPNIINEIYNSKNETERRGKQMIIDAKQVKVDNIEDLKNILLEYLGTANRNKIVYDMQDKTLNVKMPTNDSRNDALIEMERDLVINLTDMSCHIKIETMDFSAHSGGYNSTIEFVDINTLDEKYQAIYEATKANKEFFDADLSTDGPADEFEYEEYIDFEEEEHDNFNHRNADRKKTQERNRAIKNKEMSRSTREDDGEKKPQKKHHYNPNRDDDDDRDF